MKWESRLSINFDSESLKNDEANSPASQLCKRLWLQGKTNRMYEPVVKDALGSKDDKCAAKADLALTTADVKW